MKETISTKSVKSTKSIKSAQPAQPAESTDSAKTAAQTAASEARVFVAKSKAAAVLALEGRIMARLAKKRVKEAVREYEQARATWRTARGAAHEARVAARKAVRRANAAAEAQRKAVLAARIMLEPTGKRLRRTYIRGVVPLPDTLSRLIAKPGSPEPGGASPSTPPAQAGK